jgi:DNA-binding IclR family transcriptional regulator
VLRVAHHDDSGGLKSVATALDLLDCFAEDEELGVSEVARRLGVAKSTAHRLLTTLATRDIIEQNAETGRYRLGLHLFELGDLAVSRLRLRKASMGVLEELREITGWTVHLAVADGPETLYLERFATLRGMRAMDQFRRRWPAHATASGKVMAAFNPSLAEARIEAGLPRFTPQTITDVAAFRRELAATRNRGFAVARQELMSRLASVAAPVLDSRGLATASVSITGSSDDLPRDFDRHARLVIVAARRITKKMATL